MTPNNEKELDRFTTPVLLDDDQKLHIAAIDNAVRNYAQIIFEYVPISADRSAALRSIRLGHIQARSAILYDWPEE